MNGKTTRSHPLLAIVLVLALLICTSPSVRAAPTDWLIYTDPRYDFSVEYPSDWAIVPRIDREAAYGGVLRFVSPDARTEAGIPVEVAIGLYTLDRRPDQSLAEWSDLYLRWSTGFALSQITIGQAEAVQLPAGDGREAFRVQGVSPLTQFRYINVPHGETVWFLWTNAGTAQSGVHHRMATSFRLGPATPTTLGEAFGPTFRPEPRPLDVRGGGNGNIGTLLLGVIDVPDNTWFVPTPAGTTKDVLCGSAAHTGTAAYAADVQVSSGTGVYSTKRSWVDFAGWDNTGYGNLLKSNTDRIYSKPYIAYYAHLSSFVASPGQEIATGALIAYSGNTGNSTGPHLHFHVKYVSGGDEGPVNLRNLNTFAENGLYPSGSGNCGQMSR